MGNVSALVSLVQKAIAEGAKPDSPLGREVAEKIKNMVPNSTGAVDLIKMIDGLIPDAVQSKFGFTPAVMQFIREALGEKKGAA